MIIGCDGVWDEMTSEEAVGKVARLLLAHQDDPSADIAVRQLHEQQQRC